MLEGDNYYLDLNPEPWTTSEASVGRKNGKAHVTFYKGSGLVAYQEAVKEALEPLSITPAPEGTPLRLEFYFWRQVASYTGEREGHRMRADATNLQKGLEDALQGILYENDRDVRSIKSFIVDQGPDAKPGIIVRLFKDDGRLDSEFADQMRSVLGHPSANTARDFVKRLRRDEDATGAF